MNLGIFIALMFVFAGCASVTPQSDAILREPSSYATEFQIQNVPFINQTAGYCGPASLAMVLNFLGKSVTLEEIGAQAYTPGLKGSLQEDMIGTARRQGLVVIPIKGFQELMAEVRAGHPVIVFENLALTWLPQWHYAVVFGYDLSKQKMIMHSGPEAFKHWDIRKFERSWMLADYWGIVVLPPGELSVSGNELSHLKATVALEKLGKTEEAKKSYQQIQKRWPQSLGAAIGVANIAYTKGDYQEAIHILQSFIKENPQSATAWHNLAIAQGEGKRIRDARRSAQRALLLANAEEKAAFENSLGQWLK